MDDDPDTCSALRLLLEERGAVVLTASSGREARPVLESWSPSLLVSDIRLPEEDGCALVRQLHSLDRFRTLPAIAITAYDVDRGRIAEAGFQACFGKPVLPEDFVTVAASLVHKQPSN